MSWAQVASAGQITDVAQKQINKAVKSQSTDSDNQSDCTDIFYLRGPIEEEIHHTRALPYKPNLNLISIISYPLHLHLRAQEISFERIKPPSFS